MAAHWAIVALMQRQVGLYQKVLKVFLPLDSLLCLFYKGTFVINGRLSHLKVMLLLAHLGIQATEHPRGFVNSDIGSLKERQRFFGFG